VLEGLARELAFQTVVATTGEEGLAMTERYRPSAIVLDVGLPDRSGLSVLDTLKHRSTTRHIPVHVVSATDHTQTALEMGALGYAIKPVKREQLVEALQRLETKFTQQLRRILIVEDDDVARESTSHLLAGPDVETVAVGTAAAALGALESTTFDCMVLDLRLPDISGFEVLEEIQKDEALADLPVVVFTGRDLTPEEDARLRTMARSIVVKGAASPERLYDETALFLHQVADDLPEDKKRMLERLHSSDEMLAGRTALVVDDDTRNIFALSSALERRGMRVLTATTGREAIAILERSPEVTIVLMDIMMPEMDGYETIALIRGNPALRRLPIVALTAKAMKGDREKCLEAGASDYLAKPVNTEQLFSALRLWLHR